MQDASEATSTTAAPKLSRLGKYRLIAQLGSGGMATVYLAVLGGANGFNKLVVLKIPKDDVAADPVRLAMFLDEARLAARLMHPNVVQTFEVIHEANRDIIVMEYLDGYSLNDLIVRGRKTKEQIPLVLHLQIISEALSGLHYAHEAKDFDGSPLELVHRDVSPHNVFLTFDGQVKLLDFGIAKVRMQSHQTEAGTFKGKVRYMPVEQLSGGMVDRRTDIFAVGAMLWEAAVGERLWKSTGDVEVIGAIIAGKVPMPRDVKPEVAEGLDAICRKALAHSKDDRYADCLELQRDLDEFIASADTQPRRRNLGTYLEAVFGERRAERSKTIEAQLKSLTMKRSGTWPLLDPLPSASPSEPSLPMLEASSVSSLGSASATPAGVISESDPSGSFGGDAKPRTQSRGRTILAIACAAGIVIAVALLVSRREAPKEPTTSPVAALTPPTPTPDGARASATAPPSAAPDESAAATATSSSASASATTSATSAKTTATNSRWSPAPRVQPPPPVVKPSSKPTTEPTSPPAASPPSTPPAPATPKTTRPDLGY